MTDHPGTFVKGRERISARRAQLPGDVIGAAGALVESLGLPRARRWVRDLETELVAGSCSTSVIVDLAAVTDLIAGKVDDQTFAAVERAIVAAVTVLTGSES
ncbi:MAG: hypothetical protein U0Q22_03650 [Acidimicrobiales bacterium]